jgi:hypothetical protein
MQSLERIKNKLDNESDSRKTGICKTPEKKKDQEVLAGIIVIPRNIPIRRGIVVQAHILP